MALSADAVVMLGRYLPVGRVLCLGYPDLNCDEGVVASAWGGGTKETVGALHEAGCSEVVVVDAIAHRGTEVVLDLNGGDDIPGRYDLVIDPGTLEHCFNIGMAFGKVLRATEVGGVIFHSGPVSMVNHGFWNINPAAIIGFYEANGCVVESFRLVRAGDEDWREMSVAEAGRRMALEPEMTYRAAVRKTREQEVVWPIQAKYLKAA